MRFGESRIRSYARSYARSYIRLHARSFARSYDHKSCDHGVTYIQTAVK